MGFITKIKTKRIMFRAFIAGLLTMGKQLTLEEEKAMGRFVFGKKTWEKMHPDLKSNEQYAMIQPEEAEEALTEHLEKEVFKNTVSVLDDDHTNDDLTIE